MCTNDEIVSASLTLVDILFICPIAIIRSLASACLCACHRFCGRNFGSNLMKLCTVVWSQKTKIEFVRGSKSDIAFPYFTPKFSPFFNTQCIFIETVQNTSVSTPVDRLWLLTSYTTHGCIPENGITPMFPKLPKITVQCIYNGNMLI